ncbi:zinc ribbon domain-containing protein, partial [Gemmatimonadota bacterium]
MTDEISVTLKGLQDLDLHLEEVRARVTEFDPLLAEIDEPALALEGEVTTLRGRLQEMKVEERRLEHSADDRRSRTKMLQERLKSVRNLREEAAVQAEMDLVKRAMEGDEQEALTLLDQIRKMEVRLDELEADLSEAQASVEPRRLELQGAREAALEEVALLQEKRAGYAALIPPADLQNYERIRSGGRSVAIASLTADGACGHCFGMIPVQV